MTKTTEPLKWAPEIIEQALIEAVPNPSDPAAWRRLADGLRDPAPGCPAEVLAGLLADREIGDGAGLWIGDWRAFRLGAVGAAQLRRRGAALVALDGAITAAHPELARKLFRIGRDPAAGWRFGLIHAAGDPADHRR